MHSPFLISPFKNPWVRSKLLWGEIIKRDTVHLHGFTVHYVHIRRLRSLYREIFLREVYGLESWESISTIIDVGANIGLFTLYARTHAPGSTITCYEPQPELAKCIANTFTGDQDITVYSAAVTDRQGVGYIQRSHVGDPKAHLAGSGDPVFTIAASSVVKGGTDLLKLDTEGSEVAILTDLAATGKLGLVKRIFVEIHDHNAKIVLGLLATHFRRIQIAATCSRDCFLVYADRSEE